MTGFQTAVQLNPAYGIPGDFATSGPFTTVPAGPGELTAGSSGVTIARFAWADDSTGVVSNAKPNSTSTRFGFVGRNQRAIITTYLAESSFLVNAGMEITLYNGGAFLIALPSGGGTIGQKVFAKYADGSIVLGTAGSPSTSTLTLGTTSGSPNITYSGGTLVPGMPITGTGIQAGSTVVSVNSGAGTAVLSQNATATGSPTATITTTYETAFWLETQGVQGDVATISTRGF